MGCFLTAACKVQECACMVGGSCYFYIFHSLDSFVTSIMYERAKCFKFDADSPGKNH